MACTRTPEVACSGAAYGGAVGNGHDLAGVDIESGAQPFASRLRHDHDTVCRVGDGNQHRPLVWCRIRKHGVGDDDGGDVEVGKDFEDLVAVAAAVQAVFVLHDHHVAFVQKPRGGSHGP